jgi:hypothetical protein
MKTDPLILPHHPESMSPGTLARLLVQHQKLQQQIVSRFVAGSRSGDRLHVLLVGRPGFGKTHLLSLICHQLSQHSDLHDSLRIVRFGPAEICTGLLSLALSLSGKLALQYPQEFSSDTGRLTATLSPEDAGTALLHSIVQQLQHRSLLLVHENLDQVFQGLSDAEQKRWRAFLQETRRFSTLAASPTLFPDVSDRNRPCFGFFDIHHLQALKPAASRQLVLRICRLRHRNSVIPLLQSPAGTSRLQAADVLLAGNPRAWVLLTQTLTTRTLKQFTPLLEQTFDALTPACLGILHHLSPQQRQLLLGLCDQSGAKTVQQLAVATGVDERCCSRQLGYLRDFGLVHATKLGKESCYDVSDPLLRLCLQPLHDSHHPLRLTAAFLKDWFAADLHDTVDDPWHFTPTEKNTPATAPASPQTQRHSLLLAEDSATTSYNSDHDARSLILSALALIDQQQLSAALAALQAVQQLTFAAPAHRTLALFAALEPALELSAPSEFLHALSHAFQHGAPDSHAFAGNPTRLLSRLLRRSPHDWHTYISRIATLFLQHQLGGRLAVAMVRCISTLDQAGLSAAQLQLWNSLWQQAGTGCPELQIALRCTAAAVSVLTGTRPSVRPLFQLPLEIRRLVRPLLSSTLGPVEAP